MEPRAPQQGLNWTLSLSRPHPGSSPFTTLLRQRGLGRRCSPCWGTWGHEGWERILDRAFRRFRSSRSQPISLQGLPEGTPTSPAVACRTAPPPLALLHTQTQVCKREGVTGTLESAAVCKTICSHWCLQTGHMLRPQQSRLRVEKGQPCPAWVEGPSTEPQTRPANCSLSQQFREEDREVVRVREVDPRTLVFLV